MVLLNASKFGLATGSKPDPKDNESVNQVSDIGVFPIKVLGSEEALVFTGVYKEAGMETAFEWVEGRLEPPLFFVKTSDDLSIPLTYASTPDNVAEFPTDALGETAELVEEEPVGTVELPSFGVTTSRGASILFASAAPYNLVEFLPVALVETSERLVEDDPVETVELPFFGITTSKDFSVPFSLALPFPEDVGKLPPVG